MTPEGYATFEDLDSQYGPLIDHEIQLDLADFVWKNNIDHLNGEPSWTLACLADNNKEGEESHAD